MTKLSTIHLLFFASCMVMEPSSAWTTTTANVAFRRNPFLLQSTSDADGSNIESMSVENLENHEEDGSKMAESIVRWLDTEWMPQDVHVRMAETAKLSYIRCREAGDADVMSIMTTVADDLTEKWHEFDADAFINAWDISNYVSDYLYQMANGEKGCNCSTDIH